MKRFLCLFLLVLASLGSHPLLATVPSSGPFPLLASSSPEPCQELGRALVAAAHESADPELGEAMARIVEKGFLPRLIATWESLHSTHPMDPRSTEWWKEDVDLCADLERIRATARVFIKKNYPGLPVEGGRAYRVNEDPPAVWRTDWYVEGRRLTVLVDTDRWEAYR